MKVFFRVHFNVHVQCTYLYIVTIQYYPFARLHIIARVYVVYYILEFTLNDVHFESICHSKFSHIKSTVNCEILSNKNLWTKIMYRNKMSKWSKNRTEKLLCHVIFENAAPHFSLLLVHTLNAHIFFIHSRSLLHWMAGAFVQLKQLTASVKPTRKEFVVLMYDSLLCEWKNFSVSL